MHGGSGLNKNIGVGLEKEQTMVMPAMRKLMARSNVFEGYVAQYDLLVSQKLTPARFEQTMLALPESSAVEGYYILEPAALVEPLEQVTSKRFPFQRPMRSR
jgi:hypothetical protein